MNIDQSKLVFLHMGDMRKRKGTIDILDSIPLINVELYDKLCFIFAGKISNEIKETFYQNPPQAAHQAAHPDCGKRACPACRNRLVGDQSDRPGSA